MPKSEDQNTQDPVTDTAVTLVSVLKILWQRKGIMALVVVLFVAAGIVASIVLPPTYQSSGLLLPTENSSVYIMTFLKSSKLRKAVSTDHPYTLSAKPKKDLIHFVCTAGDPDTVHAAATQTMDALAAHMREELETAEQAEIRALESVIAAASNEFAEAWNEYWDLDKISLANLVLFQDISQVKRSMAELRAEDALSRKYHVVVEPSKPKKPRKPRKSLLITGALLMALISAPALALLLEAFKRAAAHAQAQ